MAACQFSVKIATLVFNAKVENLLNLIFCRVLFAVPSYITLPEAGNLFNASSMSNDIRSYTSFAVFLAGYTTSEILVMGNKTNGTPRCDPSEVWLSGLAKNFTKSK